MSITIKEIALEAGVSAMTVSNVINHNFEKVSEETRRRVKAVIDKYHYSPNMSARSLSARNSRIIALLLPVYTPSREYLQSIRENGCEWSPSRFNALADHYRSILTGLIEAKLKSMGYYVMLRSFQTVEEVLELQRNWRVDGCIMITPMAQDESTRQLLRKTYCPIVVIDRCLADIPMLSVLADDYQGGCLAARECVRRGHRRIGFLSARAMRSMSGSNILSDRYRGYCDVLRDSLLPVDGELFFHFDIASDDGSHCMGRMLGLPPEKRPTARYTRCPRNSPCGLSPRTRCISTWTS